MIAPAPRKPIPVTICAAIRVGSNDDRRSPFENCQSRPPVRGDEREERRADARRAGACAAPPRAPAARARSRSRRRAPRPARSGGATSAQRELRHRTPPPPPAAPRRSRSIPARRGPASRPARSRENGAPSGRRLHLDEPAVAGHDDVHVDLRARVLGVVEVEQRLPVDDADRDRGDGVGAAPAESPKRSSARRAATYAPQIAAQRVPPSAWSTSQSSQQRPLAERLHVGDRAQRAADQPLDLDRAALLLARARLALGALARRGRQQRVLGRQPARAAAASASAARPPRSSPCRAPASAPARSDAEPCGCSR